MKMADTFSDEEIKQLGAEIDEDFTPDISEEEAMAEVNKARQRISFKERQAEVIAEMRKHNGNPKKLWQLAYDWLMESNPEARADVKAIIRECEEIRNTRANKHASSGGELNLRWGMRIPEIVLDTLTLVDPRIRDTELLDPDEQKKIYNQMAEVFPQFRIPKQK